MGRIRTGTALKICTPKVSVLRGVTVFVYALCYLPFFQEMGGKSVDFFVTSNLFISASSRATLTIKIFKIIFMIRAIDWRALYGRARGCARENRAPTRPTLKKLAKSSYYGLLMIRRSARTIARTNFSYISLDCCGHGDAF